MYQKLKVANKKPINRIDIIHTDSKHINIIEVKVKRELDVIAQVLDYYIFIKTHKHLFEKSGWDKLKSNKNIRCYILCTQQHIILKDVAEIYRKFGFNNLKILEKQSGQYNNFL